GATDGGGSGAAFTMSAGRRASIASTSTIDVRAADAGGIITITSTGELDVLGTLLADATRHSGGIGGPTPPEARPLNPVHGAAAPAPGAAPSRDDASTVRRPAGQRPVTPSLKAGGHNRLEYRDAQPTIGPFATINPGPDLVLNANLPCCEDTCGPSSTTT